MHIGVAGFSFVLLRVFFELTKREPICFGSANLKQVIFNLEENVKC